MISDSACCSLVDGWSRRMIIGVMDDGVVGGRLADWISLGLLTSSVPRDVVDEVVAVTGRRARRSDGTLPPRMMVYYAMALALFADDDYEEVAARLGETLASWGCLGSPGFSGQLTIDLT